MLNWQSVAVCVTLALAGLGTGYASMHMLVGSAGRPGKPLPKLALVAVETGPTDSALAPSGADQQRARDAGPVAGGQPKGQESDQPDLGPAHVAATGITGSETTLPPPEPPASLTLADGARQPMPYQPPPPPAPPPRARKPPRAMLAETPIAAEPPLSWRTMLARVHETADWRVQAFGGQ